MTETGAGVRVENCHRPCHMEKACAPKVTFRFLISYFLQVEEVKDASDCCKIVLFFRNNPYFCNTVIVKEYLMTLRGKRRLPAWVELWGNWRLKGHISLCTYTSSCRI